MQPCPYYDEMTNDATNDYDSVTDVQWIIVVAMMYLSLAIFLSMLFLALYNTWEFIIRQKKYKTVPLLVFYVIVIMLASLRIYFSVFYFYGKLYHDYFGYLMKPLLNLNLGVVQCWILFELALRINENVKQMKQINQINSADTTALDQQEKMKKGQDRIESIIWYGRFILFTLIPIELIGISIWLIIV